MTTRCSWATKSPELMVYHDTQWGKPTREVQTLFRALCLEILQAGLAFQVILKHEDGMDQLLHRFSINYLAKLDLDELNFLCRDKRMIRNRRKIQAIIDNAKIVSQNPGYFVDLTWAPVHYVQLDHVLVKSLRSEDYQEFVKPFVSAFKEFGLKRIGPVTVYSYLQAVGVINDHLVTCDFR
ncbi:DNA-3-methyladenine glycosylase I [Lentilactobacillus raoultii]|uniref:DNA-3-methyladenine glycosylase I n=1 Tax=Lentilactobacillus raoultii TaxID=1987503 RepID=A0ABW3PJY3_9LACO|nr:DNA-3-methyladenine glycosylase I [Lentilactobacillus raoultii]